MADDPQRRSIDLDVRQLVVGIIGVLLVIVGVLVKGELSALKDSVAQSSAEMKQAVKTINEHSTTLATHELRLQRLEAEAAKK